MAANLVVSQPLLRYLIVHHIQQIQRISVGCRHIITLLSTHLINVSIPINGTSRLFILRVEEYVSWPWETVAEMCLWEGRMPQIITIIRKPWQ